LKVRRAIYQGRPWDAVAFASIAVLHIGLAALNLEALSAGVKGSPPGLATVGATLSKAGPAQARVFWQFVSANPRLAD